MAVPETTSSSVNGRAVGALALGLAAALTMPVAILATRYSGSYELLHAGFAIPIAVILAASAIRLGGAALKHDDARLGRVGGRRAALLGQGLGVAGAALAATALVALTVYGLLTYLGER